MDTSSHPITSTPRDESLDVAKGILILLVALGHNFLLCQHLGPTWRLLYHFHVGGFLLLPFFLSRPTPTYAALADRAVRYLYPYLLFVTFASFLNVLFISKNFGAGSFQQLLSALFLPTYASIKNSCGLSLYWFLPCLFVLTTLRYLLQFLPKNMGLLMAFASHLSIGLLPREHLTSIPWVIPTSLHFLFLGLVVEIFRSHNWRPHRALTPCLFALSLGAAFTFPTNVNLATSTFYSVADPLRLLTEDMLLLSSFYWILQVSKQLTRFRSLVLIGQQSLGIYLTHSIIFFALYSAGKRLQLPVDRVPLAAAIYFLTVAISLILSLSITRIYRTRKFFFPRDREELRTLIRNG